MGEKHYIIGVDEVGRGCLAGDVYTAGVLAPVGEIPVVGVTDSKALSYKKREELSKALAANTEIRRCLASATASDIDGIGIVKTVAQCFVICIEWLLSNSPGVVDEIVVDGMPLWPTNKFSVPTRFLPKADVLVWAVSAASILAKVARDHYIEDAAKTYPGYGWEKNKSYGTADHMAAIEKLGLTPLHRRTFCSRFIKQTPFDPSFDLPDLSDIFG